MVKVLWTIQAKEDLKEIFDYIARDSSKYAHLQISRIRSRTKVLRTNSLLGKVVPEFNNEKVRELVEGNYRIIYHLAKEDYIEILLIHHGARQLGKRFSEKS